MNKIIRLIAMVLAVTLLTACGGGGSSRNIHGSGVKGPLAGAIVHLYRVDFSKADLKGTLLDEGSTGSNAAIMGLSIGQNISGLVLLEFIADAGTIDINTGVAPVIDHLTTVFNVQRVYDGDDIYATPLTTMTVNLAKANADKGAPYSGNGDHTITTNEFTAALAVAQNQVKSTLGFGLDSSVDVFTIPPILTEKTTTTDEQAKVVKYREAIEAVAAFADKAATDSSANDTPQEIFDGLTEDLVDGTIDGMNDATPVTTLAALDTPIDTTLGSLDPTTLVIPNTTSPITDIKQTLSNELATTGEAVDTTPLAVIDVNPAPPALVAESHDTYAVGGTISGLSGSAVLQNNAGDDLTLSANGTFTFSTPIADGDAYDVSVLAQPTGQTCTASSNTGTVSGSNVTAVVVTCSTHTYTIGGNITGLTGSVVLQNNSSDDLTVSANGAFTFSTPIAYGSTYNVSVLTQPAGQTCTASTNSGTVGGANITNVAVTCSTNTYTVGGTASGLTGSVVLQNNGSDDLAINANGAFTFSTPIAEGGGYGVTVLAQPMGQICALSNNTGSVSGANVTTVTVSCVNTYTIGGAVSGLMGSVVVQNNGGDNLTLNANGAFAFGTPVVEGSSYNVTVLTQPTGQTCTTSTNTGTASGSNVTNVSVACTTNTYTIGGTVSGLTGNVVLQNNGGDDLTLNADGSFTFSTPVAYGGTYSVSVLTQPSGQTCTASSNTGTVSAANVTGVSLFCATNPVIDAEAKPGSVTLSWNDTGATGYDLYYSTAPGCDIANYAGCAGGAMVANVTSPYTVSSLTNGQNYWFQLESVAGGGNTVSNEAGSRPARLVPNRAVHAIVHDATSGVTYLGGNFTGVGMSSGSGVPLSMTTGHPGAFPPVTRSGGSGMVNAVVSDGAGGYYIGGYFDTVDGQPRSSLAHILADGTLGPWSPSVNLIVNALAVSNSTVYVGGLFTSVTDANGTYTRRNLAAIDTGGNVTSWDPSAGSMVYALAASGSMVYVGGSFTSFSGGTRNHLAAFDTNSLTPSIPTSWDPNAGGTVYALAVSGNMVYVGGTFTDFGSGTYPRNHLAAFDTNSLTPSVPTGWDPNAAGTVYALAVSGSTVYVGGYFTDFGSGAYLRNSLAAFDTGSLTPSVPTGWTPSADNIVEALAVSGSTVYAGGQFTTIDDGNGAQTRSHLAAIGTDGTLGTWNPAPDNTVLALAVSDSTVYAGGSFISTGSEPRNLLAAINADGTLNTAWHPNASGSGAAVYALAVSGGTVYVGGDFTTVDDGNGSGSQTRNKLAAIGTDGTLSTTWHPSANNIVRALEASNGTVYVGGQFATIDDGSGVSTRIGLAAIDASTGLLTAWDPRAAGAIPRVYALAVSGSTVYAGGDFDGIGIGSATPLTRSNLAAIDTSGAGTVLSWNPSADNWVYSLAVSGSTVYAGGTFTTIGGVGRNKLAAIGTDGTLGSWSPSANNTVSTLAVSGSTVYVGGSFTTIDDGSGAQARNRLAAIDAATGLLSAWNPDASSTVSALAVSGSSVFAGGGFLNIEGEYRPNFSALAP